MVENFVDACGHISANSGFLKIGMPDENGVFVSDEKDVTIDYPFTDEDKSIFFHPELIAVYVHKAAG